MAALALHLANSVSVLSELKKDYKTTFKWLNYYNEKRSNFKTEKGKRRNYYRLV